MSHIAISLLPGKDEVVKKKLAIKVRKFLSSELNIDENIISVSIEDIPLEHWETRMRTNTLLCNEYIK